MSVLAFLYANLNHFRRKFFLILFASVVAGVSSFLIPVVLAQFTEGELTAGRIQNLMVVIVALYVIHVAFQRIVRGPGEALAAQFANYLRGVYFGRIERLPVERLNRQSTGNVLSLTIKVADETQRIIFSLFWELAPGIVTLVLFLYFTVQVSWLVGGVNFVLLAVFVGVGILLSRRMVPLSAELNLRQAALMETLVDLMANIMTVKKLGVHDFAGHRLQSRTNVVAEQITRVQRFHANRWLLLHSLYGAAYLTTIGIIVWHVGEGVMALSLLILFIGSYGSVRGLIERLSENIKSFMEMRAYLRSLENILSGAIERPAGKKRSWKEFTFEDVRFSYGSQVSPVKIPTFRLLPGDHIAITGPSGQGKSTCLSLLAGYHDPESGTRLVDGKTYNECGQAFLDTQFALISQDVELFDLTLRENITLGAKIDDAALQKYFAEIGLGAWLAQLEHGLDTRVGEKGVLLSAGQKQRINLLRGLLLDRPIYILDEPTSHLDDETEELIVRLLERWLKHKTVVIVTHRPALQRLCAKAYVMRDHTLEVAG